MTPRSLMLLCLLLVLTGCAPDADIEPRWSDSQVRLLQSLSLASLGAPPPSPSNRVADDPRAIEFGQALFNDPIVGCAPSRTCMPVCQVSCMPWFGCTVHSERTTARSSAHSPMFENQSPTSKPH